VATLTCRDDGVGMTKRIISSTLLVSGQTSQPDITDLQMRCRRAGIELERTAEFGIGVLSYFMLADRVTFRTRRSQQAGSTESHGWEFVSWGIGSFGELRPFDFGSAHGTEVVLELKSRVGRGSDGAS